VKDSIGFIGGGRVVSILLGGWTRAGAMPGRVTVFDCSEDALARLEAAHPRTQTTGVIAEATSQDVVFLAVHPSVVKEVVSLIRPELSSRAVLVSFAPKFTVARLSEMLDGFRRIARTIPNAPSLVGEGLNPVTFGPGVEAGDRETVRQLLQPLGECLEVPEEHLEAYAIVTAMGPTYFWPLLYELKSLGKSFGLSEGAAMQAVEKMLCGTTATMRDAGLSAEQVQDLIPVKPLADETAAVAVAYREKLTGLMAKIRP